MGQALWRALSGPPNRKAKQRLLRSKYTLASCEADGRADRLLQRVLGGPLTYGVTVSRGRRFREALPVLGRLSSRLGTNEIWSCDANGRNCRQLTSFSDGNSEKIAIQPSWSPNGRFVTFTGVFRWKLGCLRSRRREA